MVNIFLSYFERHLKVLVIILPIATHENPHPKAVQSDKTNTKTTQIFFLSTWSLIHGIAHAQKSVTDHH